MSHFGGLLWSMLVASIGSCWVRRGGGRIYLFCGIVLCGRQNNRVQKAGYMIFVYLDDILILGNTPGEVSTAVKAVLKWLHYVV